jgi:methyl-accepting chemotaxis protein
MAAAPKNIFDVRTAQLASASAVRGALLDTKEAAARFVESADRVFADVQNEARAQSRYFGSLIADYSRVLTVLSLLCVLGAVGVFLYINRSVISRLQKLSENMRQSANGTAAPILISGKDEIADMAKAADFFATSLAQREQGLRESVAELRALGEVTSIRVSISKPSLPRSSPRQRSCPTPKLAQFMCLTMRSRNLSCGLPTDSTMRWLPNFDIVTSGSAKQRLARPLKDACLSKSQIFETIRR